MKVFQVVVDGEVVSEYTTFPEALREAVIAGSVDIFEIEREDSTRRYSMSSRSAPEDYRWHHSDLGEQDGDGLVVSNSATIKREWRRIRREFLRPYPLIISQNPEKDYRYWRWVDPVAKKVVWWERRPWSDPLPNEPGFWPDNG